VKAFAPFGAVERRLLVLHVTARPAGPADANGARLPGRRRLCQVRTAFQRGAASSA
jgi:hypothetical protein